MQRLRLIATTSAALGALVLTASCDSGGGRTPCPAGKLCLEYGNGVDPTSLDPALTSLVNEDHILGDVFVGLTQDDENGMPVPGVATSWDTSADGLTWTFHLRPSKWSDGVDLTADDFVFSMRRLVDPKTASDYANLLYVVKNGQAVNTGKLPLTALGVEATDPNTLVVHLEHPAPYFLYITTHQVMYPTPRHVVEKWGSAWAQPAHWVSNGPYMITEYKLGDRVQAVKNPLFFDARSVCIDRINYYPTTDSISAERRVRRGELDFNDDVQGNRVAFLLKDPQMRDYVKLHTWLGTAYVALNVKDVAAFRDVRVRQALAMAIDRDFVTRKLLRAGQQSAYVFVPPGTANYPGGAEPHWASWSFEKRQAEARRLLAEAGYGPGAPLRFQLKMSNSAEAALVFTAVQADWKTVGAEVSLVPEEGQIAYADYSARDFQVAAAGWIADYNDPMTFLFLLKSTTGPQNISGYANPAFDALLDQADHEPDAGRRGELLQQAERMAMEDAPIAPIDFYVSKRLVSPRLTGWTPNLADIHRTRYVCFKDRKPPGQ
jgi:oligopeptide transport system substrate-binding protein